MRDYHIAQRDNNLAFVQSGFPRMDIRSILDMFCKYRRPQIDRLEYDDDDDDHNSDDGDVERHQLRAQRGRDDG